MLVQLSQPLISQRSKHHAELAASEHSQELVNKAVANFTKRLTMYMAVAVNTLLCSYWAAPVNLSISKSALSSHHQQTGSFQIHQQAAGADNARNAEKWGRCLG